MRQARGGSVAWWRRVRLGYLAAGVRSSFSTFADSHIVPTFADPHIVPTFADPHIVPTFADSSIAVITHAFTASIFAFPATIN